MAKHVLAGFEGMDEVIVRLLSIGRPVDSPKLTDTDIVVPGGVSAAHRRPIHDIVGQSLAHTPALVQRSSQRADAGVLISYVPCCFATPTPTTAPNPLAATNRALSSFSWPTSAVAPHLLHHHLH